MPPTGDQPDRPSDSLTQPDKLAAAPVAEALRWFFRAVQTLRTYPIDNEISRRALTELGPRFAAVLPLTLNVRAEGLEWEQTPLLDERGAVPPLVGSLFKHGVRRIKLDASPDTDELLRLLLALARPLDPEDLSEDYVTRLWEADLPHVHISAIDPYLDAEVTGDVLEGKQPPMAAPEADDSDAAGDSDAESQIPPPPDQAFQIRAEDGARVAEEIQGTADVTRWLAFVDAAFDAAATQTGEHRGTELVEILEAYFHLLVRERQLGVATTLVDRMKSAASTGAAALFGPTLERLAQPDRLGALHEGLEAKSCDPRDVRSLLVHLGPHSVAAACRFLEQSAAERTRRLYAETLAEIGDLAVPLVVKQFRQSSGEARRVYAFALGALRGEGVVSALLDALADPHQAVRHEVVRALAAQPETKAIDALIRIALEDADAGCRIIALRGLGNARTRLDYRKLLERIESRHYGSLTPEEQDLLFLTLGAVGGEDVVPALRKILEPTWVPGRQRRDDWPRAASALARIRTQSAVSVLEEFGRSRQQDLAEVCTNALRTATRKTT